jgi:mRNA interferase RelE/StbE
VPVYSVLLAAAAARQLRKLPAAARHRVEALLELLAEDPRRPGVRALTGPPGRLRARIGDYRVVYEIRDQELVVVVIAVGNRRDIYR